MTLLEILPVAVLGAVCGLDVVSFPQAMISRPIVSATAAGALGGHAPEGLLIGVVLELLAIDTLPFGASRYPEWGSAGVVGGALFASQGISKPGALPVSVFAALVIAMVSGSSMVALRRLIAVRARAVRERIEAGSGRAVTGLQLFGLTADLARGFALTFVALAGLSPLVIAVVHVWGLPAATSNVIVVLIAGSVAAGAVWRFFTASTRTAGIFAVGLLLGVALVTVA